MIKLFGPIFNAPKLCLGEKSISPCFLLILAVEDFNDPIALLITVYSCEQIV